MLLALSVAQAADPMLAFDERFELSRDRGCLSELVADLKAHWAELSAADRARAAEALSPWGAETLAPPRNKDGAPSLGADSCFGQQDTNRVAGTHFVVEWDSGADQSTAQALLEMFEFAYQTEVEEHGWQAPDGADDYLMPVYIADQNMGGAYTTVDRCGGGYLPYIVVGKDAADWGSWTETMAAHEFNHSLQFGYSYAPEFWWWEATATWIEDVVYPSYDWWADYVAGYTELPYIALSASSQSDQDIFYHMYGMAILAFYLNDWQGGEATVRGTWENARGGYYSASGQDMVESLGLDWEATYVDFITRNAAMDYDQHRTFPDIDITDTVRSLPAEGDSDRETKPQGYGQNYIRIESSAGEGDLHVTFDGDTDVPWAVVLAEITSDSVVRSEYARVEAGVGTTELTLTGFGAEDAMLIVSPLDPDDAGHTYSWTADIKSADETPSGDDTGTATGDDTATPDGDTNADDPGKDGDGEVAIGGACGCATGSGSPAGVALVAIAALAARRRR